MLAHEIERQNENHLNRATRIKHRLCNAGQLTNVVDVSDVIQRTLLKVPRNRFSKEDNKNLYIVIKCVLLGQLEHQERMTSLISTSKQQEALMLLIRMSQLMDMKKQFYLSFVAVYAQLFLPTLENKV